MARAIATERKWAKSTPASVASADCA